MRLELLLFLIPCAQAVRILHRVVHPKLPPPDFAEFGSINPPVTEFTISASLLDDLAIFADAVSPELDEAMYQVALERPGDIDENMYSISTVKSCLFTQSTSGTLVLHFSASGQPFAIDYFVSPVPQDGACPSNTESHAQTYPVHSNTTVIFKHPRLPPLPELRAPPPLTAEGEPIAPVPEKSFIQKYWVYIVIGLGALLISGPSDEPASAGSGSGSGGK
ncbi:hypothetical protein BJ138DRAFT_1140352 [Hygrophoropsis aurantiaca]|uniref:Uncharacterized protein n=1 Tax=Hygrophoropsis aurantiaca TaxID=72124 RepID=A0ACB8AT99_9AGAM|nr:hypothetical protein BJ138DRAFT_1140352 [Hygrophoropsis aurantiaca]